MQILKSLDSLKVSLRKTKIMHWIWANSMSFTKISLTKMAKSMRTSVKTTKKHLKNVIHKNTGVVFVRHKQENKAEQLISSSKPSETVNDMIDESTTEFELKWCGMLLKLFRRTYSKKSGNLMDIWTILLHYNCYLHFLNGFL